MADGLLTSENTDGYDFNIHLKKKRLEFLKKTKSIGWSFGNDGLSDSYILYRKILQDKFRIKALNLIMDKINEGLSTCLHNESPGKLVAHIRNLNYDDIWEQYTKGKITVTELTNLLYRFALTQSVCGRIRTFGALPHTTLAGWHHRPLGHANGKWMGQDSNPRCFFVTDLQSAALATRHTHPWGDQGESVYAPVGAEQMSPGHLAPP